MPISFRPVDEGTAIEWRQSFTSPAVFLDTWALRKISIDPTLKNRLADALNCKHGTLLLTPEVISEFSNFDDPRHALAADSLVISVLPNIYIGQIDEDFLSGISTIDGRSTLIPPAATEVLNSLARRGDIPLDERLSKIFSSVTGSKRIRDVSRDLSLRFSTQMNIMSKDNDFRKKSKLSDLSDSRTIEFKIFGELIRQPLLNSEEFSVNDMNDMIHTLFSIPFCDFVLLDNKWATIIERMRRRIIDSSANIKIPHVFSERNGGVERFISALENF